MGLIVGPSGSGKSTIARTMFPDSIYVAKSGRPIARSSTGWGAPDQGDHGPVHGRRLQLAAELGQAISGVEQRGAVSLRPGPGVAQCGEVRAACSILLLSSGRCPPDAVRGLFRSQIANLDYGDHTPLVVFDEFTSVVDRNVARVVSAATAKALARAHRRPLRGRHLPLRRDRLVAARLGHRHGHLDLHPEVSSTTADRACNLSLWARCVAAVCASSLSERQFEHGLPLLPGVVGRQPGGVLRHGVADRPQESLAHQPHCHPARLPGHRHRHGGGRGRGRVAFGGGASLERDGQPPRPAGPLPPFAALAGGASPQDGRGQDGEIHQKLSQLRRPSGGFV